MKRNAKNATEKDGAKGSATRQPRTPRKRACTGNKVDDEEIVHVWLDYLDAASIHSGISATRQPPTPTKRPCTGNKVDDEEIHVWLDPDAASIHCDICFMPFGDEVFMCINGHAACAECCVRLKRKCWCCGAAIGDLRCRPAETMLAEMNTLCKFSGYGCGEIIKFVKKQEHEETCRHAPYGCPVDGCGYRGTSVALYEHVLDRHAREVSRVAYLEATTVTLHKSTPFRLLALQPNVRKLFLLLNGGGEALALAGRSLYLVCLGPRPEGNVDIRYKMEVRGSGADGGALSLLGTAPCVRELDGYEANKFLFVPDAYWGPSDSVSVSVRIG